MEAANQNIETLTNRIELLDLEPTEGDSQHIIHLSYFEKLVILGMISLIVAILIIAIWSGVILITGIENCGGPLESICHGILASLC